ncbi:MAG: hypothetical protein JSU70_14005 [Phycisphaerales bacterium]|nr:MAG: hypothetical protein JSU70_14005 [Phycisphaerales bacterium]
MKRERGSNSQPFRDFWRLASAQDLLSRAGTVMMRKSPRATIWTAGITSSGYLSSYLGLPGFTGLQALVAPFVVGGGLLGIGASMKYIPRTISRRLTAVAEANDLNLMEDYKKSRVLEHLNVLWDKVFWYESDIRYSREQRQAERDQILADREHIRTEISKWDGGVLKRLGAANERDIDDLVTAIMTEKPLSDSMEKSREGFIITSIYAVKHALPQSSQAGKIGFRLGLYEDECDGAYFDRSDTKLFEQYTGNATVTDIKHDVGFGRIDGIKQIPKMMSRRFWFFLITRKVATGAGRAIKRLNEHYGTDLFNSQVLLWPGEENAGWLNQFDGARETVLELRKSIARGALGDDYENAVSVLQRMLLPCFEFATTLRVRYDPEYCDGSLDYLSEDSEIAIENNAVSDLKTYGYCQRYITKIQAYAQNVERDMLLLMDYLDTHGHRWLFDDKLALRAVKIAFHTNKNGMRGAFQGGGSGGHSAAIDSEIERAVAQRATYSDRIISLRLHHQLTMLQIAGYTSLARDLAYSD